MNRWLFKRTLLGLVNIVAEALQTIRVNLPDDSEEMLPLAEATYQIQLKLNDLKKLLEAFNGS